MALLRLIDAPSRPFMRTFGISLAVTGLVVGALLHFAAHRSLAAWIVIALFGGMAILPLVLPTTRAARLVYRVYSWPALLIGNVTSLILVTIFFYGVVTPIGLMLRLTGRDPLDLGRSRESYWREVEEPAEQDYSRQF